MAERDINRIKLVLVEKKRTAKWLAEELKKDPATISKWCTNSSQPSLETLLEIANVLEVDIKDFMGVYTTNIGWNFLMCREAAKQMKEKGEGRHCVHRLQLLCSGDRKQMRILFFQERHQRHVQVLCH